MKLTKKYIISKLIELSQKEEMKGISIGLAGSWVRDEQTDTSDIDIVLSLNKNKSVEEHYNFIDNLCRDFLEDVFTCDVDLLWLHNLEQDDKESDAFLESMGVIGGNPFSTYKEICKEIEWVN